MEKKTKKQKLVFVATPRKYEANGYKNARITNKKMIPFLNKSTKFTAEVLE